MVVFSEMEITGANVCELDDSDLKDLFVRSRHLDIHDILSCWDAGHAEAARNSLSQGVGKPVIWEGSMPGSVGEADGRGWRLARGLQGQGLEGWCAVCLGRSGVGGAVSCVRCVLCRAG